MLRFVAAVLFGAFLARPGHAFDTVLDLPGDTLPPFDLVNPDRPSVSFTDATQINLRPGGELLSEDPRLNIRDFISLDFPADSEFNVVGGEVPLRIQLFQPGTLNIESGQIGGSLNVYGGYDGQPETVVRVTGGTFGSFFTLWDNIRGEMHGGQVGNNAGVHNSEFHIFGGQIGTNYYVEAGGRVEVHGGTFAGRFRAGEGSEVLVTGGDLGRQFAVDGSVSVTGGVFGSNFTTRNTGSVTISGGTFGDSFVIADGGSTRIRGGEFGERFQVSSGGSLELVGGEFELDGVPVEGLQSPGDSLVLPTREATLTGVLLDGSPIELMLNGLESPFQEFVSSGATLRLTLAVAGDYNADGSVDELDRSAWLSAYGSSEPAGEGADGNGDGIVDAADYTIWRDGLDVAGIPVPEPGSATIASLAWISVSILTMRGRRAAGARHRTAELSRQRHL